MRTVRSWLSFGWPDAGADTTATWLSRVFNPYNAAFALLTVAAVSAACSPMQRLAWILAFAVMCLLTPRLVLARLKEANCISDIEVSVRQERTQLRLVGAVMLVVGVPALIAWTTDTDVVIQRALTVFPLGFALGYLLSHLWKVSGHVSSMAALVTFSVLMYGAPALFLAILVPLLAWARVRLREHSVWETVLGGALGVLTVMLLFA